MRYASLVPSALCLLTMACVADVADTNVDVEDDIALRAEALTHDGMITLFSWTDGGEKRYVDIKYGSGSNAGMGRYSIGYSAPALFVIRNQVNPGSGGRDIKSQYQGTVLCHNPNFGINHQYDIQSADGRPLVGPLVTAGKTGTVNVGKYCEERNEYAIRVEMKIWQDSYGH